LSFFHELKRRNVFRVGAAYVVASWLLIQVTETIFPLFGFDDTPARILVIVLAIGFIPALIFAWAFELTPEGLKKESEVDRSSSITPHTGKKLDRMIMVVLALSLGYFAFDKFILSPQREAKQLASLEEQKNTEVAQARQEGRTEGLVESYGDKSIAVLPFVNMSSDVEQEYFSDGISEELLNLLAKIPELRVISRSSAFSYKGKDINLAQVAEELNVAHILEGSVRKAGNKVRITAQLIEARSDTHLWSETYDRELDDIFAIQDDIAATVVEQLKITLLGQAPHVKEVNPEAYSLYLQARHLGRQITAEGFEQSNTLLRQALTIEPDYAAAWDGLAANYTNQAGKGLLPAVEGYRQAREAAERALAIDPDYAPAHASLGWIAMSFDNDPAQAARYFERALQLDPANTDIIRSAATLLQNLGRLDEAIALNEYANARDPLSPVGHANLGNIYIYAGHWDAAIASLQTALRLSPDYIGAHSAIGDALLYQGDAEAALAEFALEGDQEYQVKGTAMALHALGRQEECLAMLDELIERWGEEWPSEVAQVYAYVGDADAAFTWLDKAIAQNEDGLTSQFSQPYYKPINSDPRWAEFLETVGSSPERQAAIEFKVTLPK